MTPNIKRTLTSQEETLASYSGARTSTWLLPPEGRSVLEVQVIKNAAQWKDVPIEKNYLIPPYHWHWYQEEYFDVKKGYFTFLSVIIPYPRKHTVGSIRSGFIALTVIKSN